MLRKSTGVPTAIVTGAAVIVGATAAVTIAATVDQASSSTSVQAGAGDIATGTGVAAGNRVERDAKCVPLAFPSSQCGSGGGGARSSARTMGFLNPLLYWLAAIPSTSVL